MLKDNDKKVELCNNTIDLVKKTYTKLIDYNTIVRKKGQGNFVTFTDIAIEEALIEGLSKLVPGASIMSEETNPNWDFKSEYTWLIDPIDGSANMLNGFPFTITVALVGKGYEDGIISVIYEPDTDSVYYAVKGVGAFKTQYGTTEQLWVNIFDDDEGMGIFGLPWDRKASKQIFDMAYKYLQHTTDIKRIGPSSMDICRVASGQAKIYWEMNLLPWDVAAGLLVLKEAGGVFMHKNNMFIFAAADEYIYYTE